MKPIKGLLIYHCIAGFIAFMLALQVSSQGRRFVFGQLNSARIVAVFVLTFLLLSLLGTWWIWRSERKAESWLVRLDKWLIEDKRLVPFLIILGTLLLIGIASIILILLAGRELGTAPAWAPTTFSFLYSIVVRSLPISLWGLASLIALGGVVIWRYRTNISNQEIWSWKNLGGFCLGLVCLIAVLFHWFTLIFQLRFFANNPAWYWTIQFKPFTWNDFWYLLIAVLVSIWLYRNLFLDRKIKSVLVVIFLLGLFLQTGIAYRQGSGLSALREKYFSTFHSVYPLNASLNRLSILETIRDYEELYGNRAFTNTKPPGIMAAYMALDRVVNSWDSFPDDVRYTRLSWTITYGFPILSMLMVFLLYAFASRKVETSSGFTPLLAALFFVLCPNVVLFSLFPDQAIYPLLFLALVWLTVWTIGKKSFFWALLLGIVLYAAVFVAFTMLPLYPYAVFFLALSFLRDRSQWSFGTLLKVILGIAAGSLIVYLLFLLVFNYNFLPRFEKAVEINHNFDFYLRVGQKLPVGPETFTTRVSQILDAAWINNLDFAAAVGFPIYILFLVHGMRIILQALQKNIPGVKGTIELALLLSFLLLNLAGTAQGEVARLWLFWVPMVVLFAALELEIYLRKSPSLVFILVFVQIGTIFLTYHFQDFQM